MTIINQTAPQAIHAQGLWKRFGDRDVIQDVSIELRPGEVLGMVGPNGAGKTTTIRMLLNILQPDQGAVSILGEAMTPQAQERIGYLPEERGLYPGQRIVPMLTYLGQLKGMTRDDARRRADALLERVGMSEHRTKKLRELSRGMGQLIQFVATIIHRPEVIVLDEPFAGLDPVNVRLMKDILGEVQHEGTAIMFSTHQMTEVEELCDRVVMIDQGEVVLEGGLGDVKRRFRGDSLFVASDPAPTELRGVTDTRREGSGYTMRLTDGATPESVLRQLLDAGARVERFEVATPSLEDIFLTVVRERRG